MTVSDDPRAVLHAFIHWAAATGDGEALRAASALDREMAQVQKAAERFRRAVRSLGSYRAACVAFEVADESEFVRRNARREEVFWCPVTRTWE